MDPTRIDLNARSSQISEIPHDFTFKFTEAYGAADVVVAHKMILAMVSKKFRNMFYVDNTIDTSNEILMEDTSKQPFGIMIDAIYDIKPMKENLQGKSLDEVFAVLYLVNKYEIPELELAVKECISSFPITDDTVLQVAADAMDYSSTFSEAAQTLLLNCAQFLKPKLTDADSVIRFVADNGEQTVIVYKLMVLMKDMPVTCSNCEKNPCQHGVSVNGSQFRAGLKVTYNPAVMKKSKDDNSGYWWIHDVEHFTGEVKRIMYANKVEIKYKYVRESSEVTGEWVYATTYEGIKKFIFLCK